jgi:hypothetical protein
MIRTPAIAAVALVLAIVLASCGDDEQGPTEATETDRTETEEAAAIEVESPQAGDTVSSPVTVSGTANVFEGNVQIAITDAAGSELASTFTTAAGSPGDFSKAVEFKVGEAGPGVITVSSEEAATGAEAKAAPPPPFVEIPVTLEP